MAESFLIKAENICFVRNQRHILKDISLEVTAGKIVVVIGPNGAGKSTLLKLLLGLEREDSGQIKRKRKLRIGYMPQKLQVNPALPLSVERFLRLACKQISQQEIEQALQQVGMLRLLQRSVHVLSGGEWQRVLLARAILRKPDLLVLDEPAQGVDITGQAELYRLIGQLRDQLNCGVLMVSHDLHLVMSGTDQVLCLNQHICCSGHPEMVSQHPEYLRLFSPTEAEALAVYTHHHNHTHGCDGEVVGGGDEQCKH
ncbi:zinc ABC transporter ATP-binding protein ZnuC [Pelagibaculum spongiae]|uniref:zinc ABC transporter ATP-binding protein ZnuC n=1 Tax=Pelagibaculum spongiae TaxID=2080658 RepID=UPI0019D496B9|nr:zinc ABC transporter ATP-binding protein ZnuC [Pelagibaculum spongiae]